MVNPNNSILEQIYENEEAFPDRVYLTQPYGNGVVKDTTYGEFMNEARRMAAYLQSLGFEKGDKIGMISKNCDKFFIAEVAIWMAGYTTVAIFPNTNETTVRYCLENSEAKFLFVGKLDGYEGLEPGFVDVPKIAFPLAPEAAQDKFDKWDDIIAATEPLEGKPLRDPTDFSLFIYTSGSTGNPKGVVHDFGHMTAVAHGFIGEFDKIMTPNARVLSYLPIAHVFERACILLTSLMVGYHVFFAESIKTFTDDLQRARPTLFISVPRLWLKFQQGVFEKFSPSTLDKLLCLPIIGGIVKGKILDKLGLDKVQLAGSGSAPLPAELLKWYRKIGLNLFEGYGMSEDFAFSHFSKKGSAKAGYVGIPFNGVQVKIDSESKEILIKSPGQMVKYWKLPEKTKDAFDDEGYFKTGDIGERLPNGLLKITGRIKEIFKTSKGKYVSPAPIENIINSDPLIELSCVSGAGQPQPYAQVIVSEKLRNDLGNDATKKKVEDGLLKLLDTVNSQVEHHEQLQFFVVESEEWTDINGLLTPTNKLKRNAIEGKAEPLVQGWYDAKQKVIFN